jgi:hypothetical protein
MVSRARSRAAGSEQMLLGGNSIHTPESLTESQAQTLLAENAGRFAPRGDDVVWEGSTFQWVRMQPPGRRAKTGATIVTQWARLFGIPDGPTWDHGITLAGRHVQVKTSTLWADRRYVFQLPVSGDAHEVILVGVSPHIVHLWVCPTPTLTAHAGGSGVPDNWVVIDPDSVPAWAEQCGGTLRRACAVFAETTTATEAE